MVHLQYTCFTFSTVMGSFGLVILAFSTPFFPMMLGHLIVGRWMSGRYHNGQVVGDPHHCEVYLIPYLGCGVHVVAEDEVVGWVAYSSDQ